MGLLLYQWKTSRNRSFVSQGIIITIAMYQSKLARTAIYIASSLVPSETGTSFHLALRKWKTQSSSGIPPWSSCFKQDLVCRRTPNPARLTPSRVLGSIHPDPDLMPFCTVINGNWKHVHMKTSLGQWATRFFPQYATHKFHILSRDLLKQSIFSAV